jgi:hypothetical protein
MSYSREDINALFKANTAVHGEVLNIKCKGQRLPIKVTVKLQKQRQDKDYSLVNYANIVADTEPTTGCPMRTYMVRKGLYINVLVKNLHDTPIQLDASYFDDHVDDHGSTSVDTVTIQPQSEHTIPVQFQLHPHENRNGWNLFFNGQSNPMLILIFQRDENGEETICELLIETVTRIILIPRLHGPEDGAEHAFVRAHPRRLVVRRSKLLAHGSQGSRKEHQRHYSKYRYHATEHSYICFYFV